MISVILKSDLRLSLASMPDSIFTLMRGNIMEGGGEVRFDALGCTAEDIKFRIETHLRRPVTMSITGTTYTFSSNGNTATQGAAQVDEQADDVVRCPECDVALGDCECERCSTCHELIDDCECRTNTFRDVEGSGSANRVLQSISEMPRLENEAIPIVISSNLDNDASGRAKLLSDKIAQYNRMFSNLIALQNEVTRLSGMVGTDPVVAKLRNVISRLIAADNMVEDIYFTNNFIVVRTKEIITNPLRDGKRRKIGKMEFFLRLSSMLGIRSDNEAPILIRNRTRESREMECCHTSIEGKPCFGTWLEPILKAFKDQDLEQLIDLLIRFVRTPNEDDCMGRPIALWPTVEDNPS